MIKTPTFTVKEVMGGKTLGQKLKNRRRAKKITLSQAEEKTAVRLKYLKALEEDRLDKLPAGTYGLGFVKRYGEYLGFKEGEILSLYKQQQTLGKKGQTFSPWGQTFASRIVLTPRALIILATCLVISTLIGYIIYEVLIFIAPPNLEIRSPRMEQVVNQDNIEVQGQTESGAILYINGMVVDLDPSGNFSQNVKLEPGLNSIEVVASSKAKRQTVKTLKVIAQY